MLSALVDTTKFIKRFTNWFDISFDKFGCTSTPSYFYETDGHKLPFREHNAEGKK